MRQYPVDDTPRSVAIGDLDGDQLPDLAVANLFGHSISVLNGLGDGTFATAQAVGPVAAPVSVAIGDLNGDRVPDLAVASFSGPGVYVLLGVGDGTFAAATRYSTGFGDAATYVAIADLDGDQVPDLAVANIEEHFTRIGSVSVLLGVGNGTFGPATQFPGGGSPNSVAIADFDGDQMLDLALANFGGDTVSVLRGVGDGTFADGVEYTVHHLPKSIAAADLDGDGVLDLAVANQYGGNVSVLTGVGDGTFSAAVNYAAGDGQWCIAVGDLNGDHTPDLAVAGTGSHAAYDGNVSVLLGVGDGTFGTARQIGADYGFRSLAIGDFNGDDLSDVVAVNYGSDNVTVLLNRSMSDCNDNSIPDECDVECGPPGGTCDRPGCGQSDDCNDNSIPDECDVDSDDDGFPDECDECSESDLSMVIVIEECITGVPNQLLDDGCTMTDVLTTCSVDAHNHGQLTACIVRHANEWRRKGLLSGKDVGRVVHCAGTTNENRPPKRCKGGKPR